MISSLHRLVFAALPLAVIVVPLVGCKPSAPTTPTVTNIGAPPEVESHDHPDTFPAAMDQLKQFKDQIKTAFESGNPDSAHDALHEIGHVLEELPELAAKVSTDSSQTATVAEAQTKLFEAYEKLDASMHGEKPEPIKYETVAADIDAAFESLSKIGQ